jgi:hypothetical protein
MPIKTEEISTIFSEYNEIGTSHQIDEPHLHEEYLNGREKCSINRQAVETFCYYASAVATQAQMESFLHRVSDTHDLMRRIYGSDKYNDAIKQGILGEVAVALSLQKLTFDVYSPTVEDDSNGKVDLWADPREDGVIFAIQVITSRFEQELSVTRIKTNADGAVIGISDTFRQDMQEMVDYLSDGKALPKAQKIIPLLIIVPGGDINEHACYHQTTGLPTKNMVTELYDGIDRVVFSKEAH